MKVLILERDAWRAIDVPLPDYASTAFYPVGLVSEAGVHLAFISSDRRRSADDNSVFFLSSLDGITWIPAQLVSASGLQPAFEVHLLAPNNGELRILWLQSNAQGRALRQLISTDSGRTWGPAADVGPANDLRRLTPALDSCGRTHVLMQGITEAGSASDVYHAVWDGAWSAIAPLSQELVTTLPTLRRGPNGELSAAFVGFDRGRGSPGSPQLYLAVGHAR